MSLFSTNEFLGVECVDGFCLAVGRFLNNRDQLVIGSLNGQLSVIDPGDSSGKGLHLLHYSFEQPIIGVAVGKFLATTDDYFIAVLLTNKLCICHLYPEDDSYKITIVNEHNTHGHSFNMCIGQFSRSQADLLCVQSLNCTLTIYEAEQALLHQNLPNCLFPGPIAYAVYSESIITTSGGILASIKYNSLVTATSGNGGKKFVPDWMFSLGDWPVGLDTVGTPTLQPSIIVLCKRNLYCFTQGGILRFNIRLQCVATNLFIYGIEGTFLRYCIAAGRTLLFYAQNVLIWTANLQTDFVDFNLCSFGEYQNMLAILSVDRLSISYLGTEPLLFCLPSVQTRFVDFKERQAELQKLEALIRQHSTGNKSDAEEAVGLQLQCSFKRFETETDKSGAEDDVPAVSVIIDVNIKDTSPLRDVRLLCYSNFNVQKCVTVNEESYEYSTAFVVNISQQTVSSCKCHFFVVSRVTGRISSSVVNIPLFGICHREEAVQRVAAYKLTIKSSDSLQAIPEFLDDSKRENSGTLALRPLFSENLVSISTFQKPKRYQIYSDSLSVLCMTTEALMTLIREKEASVSLKCPNLIELVLQNLSSFIELEQRKVREQEILEKACVQLRGAQAALLQRLKAPRPSSVSHLGALMEYAHEQIIKCSDTLSKTESQLSSAKASLESCFNLLVYYMSLSGKKIVIDPYLFNTGRQLTSERIKWLIGKLMMNDNQKDINNYSLKSLLYDQCQMLAPVMEDINEEEEIEENQDSLNQNSFSMIGT